MDVFLPEGTRDLMPAQMRNRLAIIDRLRSVFGRFGFEPLETPAFERIETLTGKYGEEGDKLIYKIMKRGDKLKNAQSKGEALADLALRYDLTVPLARVIAMNPGLPMPFRRWQIQPVWRADRPQKGRYREFWQCDCDVVGVASPLADAECLAVAAAALSEIGFPDYEIRLNDRRILTGLAKIAGATDARQEISVLMSLDKLDKIGRDGVLADLEGRGFAPEAAAAFLDALAREGDDEAVLASLEAREALGESGREGVRVLREVVSLATDLGVPREKIRIDPTLARGLDYYTGPVFEIVSPSAGVGSISGGGRYDGLIGMFSGKPIPAVGVSLGLERILVILEEQGRLPAAAATAEVLVALYGPDTRSASLRLAHTLRSQGIRVEMSVREGKLGQQFKHASSRGIPFVALIGPDEAVSGKVAIKDMVAGTQEIVEIGEIAGKIRR